MVDTHIDLTDEEKTALNALAAITGKTQSELIREAIDNFIGRFSKKRQKAVLANAAGMWKDRDDLPDFGVMRNEWNRGVQS